MTSPRTESRNKRGLPAEGGVHILLEKKRRRKKGRPLSSVMRSQVLYQAAQHILLQYILLQYNLVMWASLQHTLPTKMKK